MQLINVVLVVSAVSANVLLRSAPEAAIGAIAGALPAGFSISDADTDANGSVTWKELYDALAPLKIPKLDTSAVKGLINKFAKDGATEGASAGLDSAEFTKMIAYLKKQSSDALIPKNPDKFDTGCYIEQNPISEMDDYGLTYRGLVTSTESGRTCQNWLDQHPHKIDIKPSKENGLGNHNFCRNPDESFKKPWCYTMDPTVEKEECEIPICEEFSREFQDEAEAMAKKVADGLECDCIEQLYGSTTTTADTAVPLSLAAIKKEFGQHNLEAAKKRCNCKRGRIAVLKRRRHHKW
eukprot:gnl/MRDRNA2_/MRDRNA2_82789_c0_seq2.p1 gnl/MRDRNA2_/MRDRNA2_82789_c0~~gnl/MRDRNA2_/MRDRNA2_82789_c0_seq2.p1  ORF type:complete len:295 (+),score=61.78 gnl/MRDRNA2_/MRDRNA2_82789_c0_seq2:71-955(+)